MWFLFGFITLISFSVFFGLQRYQAKWKGTSAVFKDVAYQYDLRTHKGSYVKLLIGCNVIEDVCFSIKNERWWDRLFKTLGITVEHQVGDAEFDRMFYLITDNKSLCDLFSQSYEFQDAVKQIHDLCKTHKLKFKKLLCRHGRIWLDLVPEKKSEQPNITAISNDLVPELFTMTGILEKQQAFFLNQKNDPFIIKAMVILAISSGLAINGLVQFIRVLIIDMPFTVDNWPLFYASLPYGLAIIGLLIVLAFIFLGRTARTHLVLIELILVGSFGAISTTNLTMRDLNIDLDISSPEYYVVEIYKKRISRSRNSKSYYLTVDDWNNGAGRVEIKVSSDIYYRFEKNQNAKIEQRAGYLGYRWVADVIK